jgi:putative ABC transport system permease protein
MSRRLPYALLILWRDRGKFLPALLAVTFSAVLIALQCGLLWGLLVSASLPIDKSNADIWVTTFHAPSLSHAYPVPDEWVLRVAAQPEIERAEPYLLGHGNWHRPEEGTTETCIIIGSRLDEQSLGVIEEVSPALRAKLTEPGSAVVDEWDLKNLGLKHFDDKPGEINQRRVRLVGTVRGFQGLNFIYFFCSIETARLLLPLYQEQPNLTMYVLAKCRNPKDIPIVVDRLRALYPDMGAYTRVEFSNRVRKYWLFRSKGGTAMLATVTLALLVGVVITGQTLKGATMALLREYAVLVALGIPQRRLTGLVVAQSAWIGFIGVICSLPVIYILAWAAYLLLQTTILLPRELILGTTLLTLTMAFISGIWTLRALRQVDPAVLLR